MNDPLCRCPPNECLLHPSLKTCGMRERPAPEATTADRRYRKRPVVIEAFRYYVDSRPDWFCDRVSTNEIITYPTHCEITTLEGVMRGEAGDWIIRGVKGVIYPCKPDIFAATYEPASSPRSGEEPVNELMGVATYEHVDQLAEPAPEPAEPERPNHSCVTDPMRVCPACVAVGMRRHDLGQCISACREKVAMGQRVGRCYVCVEELRLDSAACIEQLEAQLAAKGQEIVSLREWLWLNHGCSVAALYGDDGEQQCSNRKHRPLDFKREPVEQLIRAVLESAEAQVATLLAERDELDDTRLSLEASLHNRDVDLAEAEAEALRYREALEKIRWRHVQCGCCGGHYQRCLVCGVGTRPAPGETKYQHGPTDCTCGLEAASAPPRPPEPQEPKS